MTPMALRNAEMQRWGQRCLHVRKRLGLGQRGLAELLGCGPTTIAQTETGVKLPPQWLRRLIVVTEYLTAPRVFSAPTELAKGEEGFRELLALAFGDRAPPAGLSSDGEPPSVVTPSDGMGHVPKPHGPGGLEDG